MEMHATVLKRGRGSLFGIVFIVLQCSVSGTVQIFENENTNVFVEIKPSVYFITFIPSGRASKQLSGCRSSETCPGRS